MDNFEHLRGGVNRCYAQGPDCDGPLELHHVIKQQRIRKEWRTLDAAYTRGGARPWSLTRALADHRNLVIACKRTHHVEETAVPIPPGFWAFVAEYGLEPCLPRWLTPQSEAA